MSAVLEKITNVAIVCACVVVVGEVAYRHLTQKSASPPYASGEHIKDTPALGFHSADKTLVMVTASGCHYCAESLPFYRQLVPLAHESGVRVVAIAFEPVANNRTYLSANGVAIEAVVSAHESGFRPTPTPTLLLVNRKGKVLRVWAGLLQEQQQAEVRKSLGRA